MTLRSFRRRSVLAFLGGVTAVAVAAVGTVALASGPADGGSDDSSAATVTLRPISDEAVSTDFAWFVEVGGFAAAAGPSFHWTKAASDHVDGHGYAVVLLDGMELMRITSPGFGLGDLPPGEHLVEVILMRTDGEPYVGVDGRPVSASARIQ